MGQIFAVTLKNFAEGYVWKGISIWKGNDPTPNFSEKLIYTKEEWQAMWALVNDRSIVINKDDKGSAGVVWDNNDCILEAEKQLSDVNVYKYVSFNKKYLQELAGRINQLFWNLKSKGKITDKQLK